MNLRNMFVPLLFSIFAQVETAYSQDGPALYQEMVNVVMDIYLEGRSDEEVYENLIRYYEEYGNIRVNQCEITELSHRSQNNADAAPNARSQVSYDLIQIELARLAFRLTGYPQELWQSELEELVKQTPNKPGAILDRLEIITNRLEDYRLSVNSGLPKLAVEECGGTTPLVAKITLEPSNGRVWLISEFDAKLCELDGVSIANCPGWREETGQEFIMVLGNYRFYAQWEDGTTYSGQRSFVSELPTLDTFSPSELQDPLIDIGFNIVIRK